MMIQTASLVLCLGQLVLTQPTIDDHSLVYNADVINEVTKRLSNLGDKIVKGNMSNYLYLATRYFITNYRLTRTFFFSCWEQRYITQDK